MPRPCISCGAQVGPSLFLLFLCKTTWPLDAVGGDRFTGPALRRILRARGRTMHGTWLRLGKHCPAPAYDEAVGGMSPNSSRTLEI
ncbi:hypothetical protein C8Q79DRAFT_986944 [Trametes meyenii]|nr:hypothetical protein C8Q79DRAFT_986944 [Trametes meyenii]